jgi:hypothetical protein
MRSMQTQNPSGRIYCQVLRPLQSLLGYERPLLLYLGGMDVFVVACAFATITLSCWRLLS